MNITYDRESDVLLIEECGRTFRHVAKRWARHHLLYDEEGTNVVGVEVLDASQRVTGDSGQVSPSIGG